METRLIIRYSIASILLIFFQINFFNYLQIGTGLVPKVYIIILLLLPITAEKWLVLIFAFLYGLILDFFSDTVAVNAAAMTLAAFVRPGILNLLSRGDEGYEPGKLPSIFNFGFRWFVLYSLIIVFFHQFVYFTFEIFSLSKIGIILLKALINSIYTTIFMIFVHLLFFRNK